MQAFNIGDIVKVKDATKILMGTNHYYSGMVTEVVGLFGNDPMNPQLRNVKGDVGVFISKDELHAIELVSRSGEVGASQERVAELEAEVAHLKGQLSAYAVVKPLLPKNANEERKRAINKAKDFIEESKNFTGRVTKREGYKYPTTKYTVCDPEFIVNKDKRTVVVILRDQMDGEIMAKGIAKCHADDTFNADLGKAIALGYAIGEDVSEFTMAPQPTRAKVGDKVKVNGSFMPYEDVVAEGDDRYHSIENVNRSGVLIAILDDSEDN